MYKGIQEIRLHNVRISLSCSFTLPVTSVSCHMWKMIVITLCWKYTNTKYIATLVKLHKKLEFLCLKMSTVHCTYVCLREKLPANNMLYFMTVQLVLYSFLSAFIISIDQTLSFLLRGLHALRGPRYSITRWICLCVFDYVSVLTPSQYFSCDRFMLCMHLQLGLYWNIQTIVKALCISSVLIAFLYISLLCFFFV